MLVVSAFIVFDEIRELPFNFSLFVFLTHRAHGDQNEAAPSRPKIMVVGVYHFVGKANVYSMSVDHPLSAERQAQIKEVVTHLAKFQPTKVVLEETAGTSDLEPNYQKYLQDKFELPASENYQIGFRLAIRSGRNTPTLRHPKPHFSSTACPT